MMPKFDYEATKPPFAFKKAVKKTPDHMGNALVLLAFVAGTLVLYIVICAMIFSKHVYMNFAGWLGLFTTVGVVVWIAIDRDIIRTVEDITGHDLDGDGYVGQPSTLIEFKASDRTTWMAELPAPPHLIREWGVAALNGHSLGYRQWKRHFALLSDGTDGEQRYSEFRGALVRAGYAHEKGNHGIDLTNKGIQVFTEYVAQNPTGTPLLEG